MKLVKRPLIWSETRGGNLWGMTQFSLVIFAAIYKEGDEFHLHLTVGENKGVVPRSYTSLRAAKIAANRFHTEHVRSLWANLLEHITTPAEVSIEIDDPLKLSERKT